MAHQLAQVFLQLTFDAQHSNLSLTPIRSGLKRLSAEWPSVLQAHVPLLAHLTIAAGKTKLEPEPEPAGIVLLLKHLLLELQILASNNTGCATTRLR